MDVEEHAETLALEVWLPDHDACPLGVPLTEVDPLLEKSAEAVPLMDELALAQVLALRVAGAEDDTDGELLDD